jgi:hypothetical protein
MNIEKIVIKSNPRYANITYELKGIDNMREASVFMLLNITNNRNLSVSKRFISKL